MRNLFHFHVQKKFNHKNNIYVDINGKIKEGMKFIIVDYLLIPIFNRCFLGDN